MGRYIGIDLGTTSITALTFDTVSGQVEARFTASNTAETTSPEDRDRGRSEWDIARMIYAATDLLGALAQNRMESVDGIGVTGQQHGMTLIDNQDRPLMPF
ncbi:MAG: xylulokinase, partial [candidate division Zixibacteria bacterium]|nr:xylulokinase [candidate division Zixibacteria bacterium]